MIEQVIYFALGCIVTALLSLLFAPVFWRRALRLTRQRLALQVPLSMQEILAQRDQIRAEFAIERLRLEQAVEAVQTTKAADMAEIGRHSMVAAKLGAELAVLRQSELNQQADLDRLQRELAEATAAAFASPSAAEPDAADHRQPAEAGPVEQEKLHFELDSLRATVAALTTRGMGLEARLKDAERGLASKETEASLRARLETASEHIARHEAASLSMRRELDEAKTHIRKLERELASMASGSTSDGVNEGPAGRVPDKLELLAAENSALRGALDAVRRAEGTGGGSPDEDAGLRETIHTLGLAVAKLTRQAREGRASSDEMPRLPVKEASAHPLGVG